MLLHILLPKGLEGLGVLCWGPPWHCSPLKGARDPELCKTCVGVCTPAALREIFALSGVEERCFGGYSHR